MSAKDRHKALLHDLKRITHSAQVTPQQRDVALNLLRRFETPIAVVVIGPDATANESIVSGLNGLAADPSVRLSLRDGLPPARADWFADIDIVIWCSPAFAPMEEEIWAHAPEALQDRSVLIRLEDAATVSKPNPATALFDEVVTVSLAQQDDILTQLSKKLLRRVQTGLRADADNAAFLIEACALPEDNEPSLADDGAADKGPEVGHGPLLTQIETMMAGHAAALKTMELDGDALAARVLSSCETLLQEVAVVIETAPTGLVPDPLRQDLEDASDSILLMSLEGGVEAATDAISTLIQLRKEMHLGLAA